MNAPANLPAERRPALPAGAPVAAIVPQNLDQAYRLAQALSASGMAPRGMDKPEQVLVAIMAGAELGLAPFQAIQSFAVVNNRPCLWGDGLMAVVRARGVKVREWLEGEGDGMLAYCHVIRPDTGEEIERVYSVADAKKAGLWGKAGPWQQHPKRMLQMRARAFALRDGCADMLRGIQIREEVEDYTHAREVTSRPSGLAARLAGGESTGEGFTAHHAPAAPVEFAEQAEQVADAEFDDATSEASATAADDATDFPGDRVHPAVAWGRDVEAGLAEERWPTVDALDAFTQDPANSANFLDLQEADEAFAGRLDAALRGRRKALASLSA